MTRVWCVQYDKHPKCAVLGKLQETLKTPDLGSSREKHWQPTIFSEQDSSKKKKKKM